MHWTKVIGKYGQAVEREWDALGLDCQQALMPGASLEGWVQDRLYDHLEVELELTDDAVLELAALALAQALIASAFWVK